jgi:hypothetical protein
VLAAIATDSLKRFVYKGYRFKANVVAEYPGINKYLDIISRAYGTRQRPLRHWPTATLHAPAATPDLG